MLNQCPKCGQKLNEKSHCNSCNITYRSFRLIKEVSKSLYNEGLQKSKVRDLSGAVESLNRSIKYDKRNIDARNLLGLVYFELGETVMALRQWVVSQNIQPELNVASNYLKLVQDNQVNLDRLSTAIKKYNQALVYIRQNSRDLAIINLKKVISLNPKFVKAYTLLALLYVKEEEVSRAKNILLKVLLIDKTNYVAHKYYEDLFEDHKEEAVIVEPQEELNKNKKKLRRQIAINQSVQQFAGLVFGVAIGAALIFFLLMPGRVGQLNDEIDDYQTQLTESVDRVEELESQQTDNESKIRSLEAELADAVEKNTNLSEKDGQVQQLMMSMTSYLQGDLVGAAAPLSAIDINESTDGVLNNLYTQLTEIVFPEVARTEYNAGYSAYNSARYQEAIDHLEVSVRYEKNATYSHYAVYYLGRSYQFSDRPQDAIEQFKYLLANYPNSNTRGWAENQIRILGGTLD